MQWLLNPGFFMLAKNLRELQLRAQYVIFTHFPIIPFGRQNVLIYKKETHLKISRNYSPLNQLRLFPFYK